MNDRRSIAGRSIRWNDVWAREAYAAGHWSRTGFVSALAQAAALTPDRIAIDNDGRLLRCAELYDEARRLAAAMLQRIPTGSTVSFMLPNWWEAAVIYAASALAGMVVNPILPSLRHAELRHILSDADSRLLFITPQWRGFDYDAMAQSVAESRSQLPIIATVRGGPEGSSFEQFAREGGDQPLPLVDPDAAALILYTSGTSGRAKGVMHSQNSLRALVMQLQKAWQIDAGDRFYVPAPIGHIGGSIYSFELPILLGTTAYLAETWDAAEAVQQMAAHRITHMAGATIFLQQLLAAAQEGAQDLPDLKLFICGGASVPPRLIEAAQEHFCTAKISRVYGSTEVPVATIGALGAGEEHFAAHSDGCAALADLRLAPHGAAKEASEGADASEGEGADADAGEGQGAGAVEVASEGEITLRGPQMFIGYVNPADEADAFDGQGFFRSGDLGRLLEGRYLSVTGRAKDIIIRKGENIAPKEVEDCLQGHSAIAAIAIVGVPDAERGEMAVAVIELVAGERCELADIRQHLSASGLAAFKWPERLEIWENLPRNAAGKIVKFDIQARLLAGQKGR